MVGAGGFIGSHVVRTALAAGAESVAAVVTADPWRLSGIDDARLQVHGPGEGRWWREDYQAELAHVLDPTDAVALLAYQPPAPDGAAGRVEHELSVNAGGTFRAGVTATSEGARIVFASSADVYGPWHPRPVVESDPPEPATPYAIAKLAAEHLLALAARPRQVLAVRLGTVFGPGENGPRAIPAFTRSLLAGEPPRVHGDGSDLRDYVHVDDVAAAILNACLIEEPAAPVLNVASGRGRTTIEVLDAVRGALDLDVPAIQVPARATPTRLVLDVSRARALLGLDPAADFDRLIGEEVDWLRAQRS